MLIQSQIVDLLRDLQKRHDLTYLFISHDLRVVSALACRLIVMRNGKVVEEGPAVELFKNPKSAYTRALFAAAFNLETTAECVVVDQAIHPSKETDALIKASRGDWGISE
jgi:microcin C transport system ATP-binding protein